MDDWWCRRPCHGRRCRYRSRWGTGRVRGCRDAGSLEDGAPLDDGQTPGQGHSSRRGQVDSHGIPASLAVLGRAVDEGPADTKGQDCHVLVLHVDVESLADAQGRIAAADLPVPLGRPRMPAMSVRVLRRLACPAGRVLVATKDGNRIDVGRRQQRITKGLLGPGRLANPHGSAFIPTCEKEHYRKSACWGSAFTAGPITGWKAGTAEVAAADVCRRAGQQCARSGLAAAGQVRLPQSAAVP